MIPETKEEYKMFKEEARMLQKLNLKEYTNLVKLYNYVLYRDQYEENSKQVFIIMELA